MEVLGSVGLAVARLGWDAPGPTVRLRGHQLYWLLIDDGLWLVELLLRLQRNVLDWLAHHRARGLRRGESARLLLLRHQRLKERLRLELILK